MRKIIAIILAVVMLAAMSIPAFAAKTLKDDNNAKASDTVPVTYTSSQGYEVTIPDSFELNDLGTGVDEKIDGYATGSGEVKATKAKINIGKKLVVTVASKDNPATGASWNLKEANGETYVENGVTIAYTITVDGNIKETSGLTQGGTVLSYTSSAAQWSDQVSTMTLKTAYTNQAGSFRDLLTFTAEVVNA